MEKRWKRGGCFSARGEVVQDFCEGRRVLCGVTAAAAGAVAAEAVGGIVGIAPVAARIHPTEQCTTAYHNTQHLSVSLYLVLDIAMFVPSLS